MGGAITVYKRKFHWGVKKEKKKKKKKNRSYRETQLVRGRDLKFDLKTC